MLGKVATFFVAATAVAATMSFPAQANTSSVTACGKHGSGCVTKQVRQTPMGKQYRTKGGNWVYCTGDCRDTIRRNHLEFWIQHGG